MFDRNDARALVKAGIILVTTSTVVLTVAGVTGLAIRLFVLAAWGG